MSGFLLDTNIPSEFRNPRPEPRVVQWVDSVPEDSVFISVVTLGEIRKGCELLDAGKRRKELEQWLEGDVREWFLGRILLPLSIPPISSQLASDRSAKDRSAIAFESFLRAIGCHCSGFHSR